MPANYMQDVQASESITSLSHPVSRSSRKDAEKLSHAEPQGSQRKN